MPEVAAQIGASSGHAISWVDAMSKRLSARVDVNLSIATKAAVKSVVNYKINNIQYIVLPSDCHKRDYWPQVFDISKPDIIHIYGTETSQNIILVEKYAKQYKIIVSLQGILSEYQRHYYAGIDFSTMLRFTTIKDLLRPSGFFSGRRDFIKNSKLERKILSCVEYIEGRSTWDRVSALNINPTLKYYYCPRLIREPFYCSEWSAEKMERHSIFIHQGTYPIKGLHFVFEALAKLIRKYPDAKLYVSGSDIFHSESKLSKLLPNGYSKYLRYLVEKYGIREHIVFTGRLSAEKLAEKLTKMNVVVVPSSIENAPNSLAEAELVGTPVVASFVGGNMDMLEHGKDGFLYCYNEPNMLAEYITRIFESDDLAEEISKHSRSTSYNRHNPEILESILLEIYNSVING